MKAFNDKKRLALLVAVISLQLITAFSLLCYTARVKSHAQKNGFVIRLSCQAYDPFSPLKGRYVRLTIAESRNDSLFLDEESTESMSSCRGGKIYCIMKEGSDGLWHTDSFRSSMPSGSNTKESSDGIYVEVKRPLFYSNKDGSYSVSVTYSFTEYYMQEDYARYVDTIRWDDFNALEPVLSLYVGKDGRCVQKDLTVMYEGRRIPIEEYCNIAISAGTV